MAKKRSSYIKSAKEKKKDAAAKAKRLAKKAAPSGGFMFDTVEDSYTPPPVIPYTGKKKSTVAKVKAIMKQGPAKIRKRRRSSKKRNKPKPGRINDPKKSYDYYDRVKVGNQYVSVRTIRNLPKSIRCPPRKLSSWNQYVKSNFKTVLAQTGDPREAMIELSKRYY